MTDTQRRNGERREKRLKDRANQVEQAALETYEAAESRGIGVSYDRFLGRYMPKGTQFRVLPAGGSERHTYANRATGRNGRAIRIS
jgi:hypothetical protein